MVQHDGAYVEVCQTQPQVALAAQPVPTTVTKEAASSPALEVRSGVLNSRSTPFSSVKPMEAVSIPQP